MIFGQAPADSPLPPETTWARVKRYAGTAEQYIDAPVDDIASLISVDAVWLGGFLLGLKFLTSGLFLLRDAHCQVPKRHRS